MKKYTKVFFLFYFFFIFILIFSVLNNLRSEIVYFGGLKNNIFFLNGIQRISGVLALFLLFVQIVVGAYRANISQKLGSWVMNFHIWQGRIVYFLVLLHTFSFLVFNFVAKKGFDPFYVFADFCLLCPTRLELYYSFGRIGFWLLNLTIMAALLRGKPWWRKNWRYFHILNYPLYFLLSAHAFFVGSDFSLKVGLLGKMNILLETIVLLVVLQKIVSWFKRSFRWN